MAAASALRRAGKPLLLLKVGRSAKGAQAAASHTAAMAGSAQAYEAAFRQLGVAAVTDPTRLIDLAYLWRLGRVPAGRRAAIVSLSGAACAILADACAVHGIEVPTLDEATRRALRALVPSYGMIDNPVDLTGQITNDRASFGQVMGAVLDSPAVDIVLLYLGGYLLDLMAPALVEVAAASRKPIVVVDMSAGTEASRTLLDGAGLAYFTTIEAAAAATGRLAEMGGEPPGGGLGAGGAGLGVAADIGQSHAHGGGSQATAGGGRVADDAGGCVRDGGGGAGGGRADRVAGRCEGAEPGHCA